MPLQKIRSYYEHLMGAKPMTHPKSGEKGYAVDGGFMDTKSYQSALAGARAAEAKQKSAVSKGNLKQ